MSDLTKTYISLQSLQHLLISCRHLNSILIQKENYFLNSTFWLAMCWYPAWSFWKTCACRRSSMSSERADGSGHCWDSHWGAVSLSQSCPTPAQLTESIQLFFLSLNRALSECWHCQHLCSCFTSHLSALHAEMTTCRNLPAVLVCAPKILFIPSMFSFHLGATVANGTLKIYQCIGE